MIFAAAVLAISFAACDGKKNNGTQVPETTDFNVLVIAINEHVAKDYPGYEFYEAYARLNNVDTLAAKGEIDPTTLTVAYGCTYKVGSLQVTVDSLFNNTYHVVDEPWLEDYFMTPFVPMDLKFACELLQNNIDIVFTPGMPVVLRHQLWYKEAEPRYFIGTIATCHTVNVYTGEIDQKLAQPSNEYLDACGITEEEARQIGELVAKYEQEDSALTEDLENEKADSVTAK